MFPEIKKNKYKIIIYHFLTLFKTLWTPWTFISRFWIKLKEINPIWDWTHTFLACLWGRLPGRWIWVGIRLWARVGFRARESRSRLLILRVAVRCFLLWPWSRVWVRARRSLLREKRGRELRRHHKRPWQKEIIKRNIFHGSPFSSLCFLLSFHLVHLLSSLE